MANIIIEDGKYYRVLTDASNGTWTQVSFWTKASDVYDNDGKSLQSILPTTLVGTLPIGDTTIVFSNAKITTASTIEAFTSVYGVNPTDIKVVNGAATLTFAPQSVALDIKIRIS